jgi:hypothetical protein
MEPVKINFIHLWLLIKDAWRTKNIKDKFRIWFMPTGWRPDDVKEKYPVDYIADVYNYKKFDTPATKAFIAWSWAQMFFNYFLLIYFFAFIAQIDKPHIFYYGAFRFHLNLCLHRANGWQPLCFLYGTGKIPYRSFYHLLLW